MAAIATAAQAGPHETFGPHIHREATGLTMEIGTIEQCAASGARGSKQRRRDIYFQSLEK